MADTITGQGMLRVDGSSLSISFTVPKGPCGAEALLRDVHTLATKLTDLSVSRVEREGKQISCAKGCGACCRQLVPITPTEARQLVAAIDKMPRERAEAVRARFAAARTAMADAALPPRAHPDTDPSGYRAFGLAWFRQGVPCPFLEDESCSIHAIRPLVCREYLVTSPAANCARNGDGEVSVVPVPIRLWAAFGKSASPERALDWMPLCDAIEYTASTPPENDRRSGPQRVEALLREIQV